MKKVLISLVFVLSSCESKTSFIYLNIQSSKSTKENSKFNEIFDATPKGNKIQEYVLVKNAPSEKIKLKEIMISYFDSLKTIERDTLLSERSIYFYKYSSKTKAFINSERDYDGLSRTYIYDQVDDYLGSIVYRKYFADDNKQYTIISMEKEIDTLKGN